MVVFVSVKSLSVVYLVSENGHLLCNIVVTWWFLSACDMLCRQKDRSNVDSRSGLLYLLSWGERFSLHFLKNRIAISFSGEAGEDI